MRRPRGRCVLCGERRALNVDMCDSCVEQERFGREQHEELMAWQREVEMSEQHVAVQTVGVKGQCAWCLQSDLQAFALVCPDHVSDWRNSLHEIQEDIRALCRAVGEFDGARPDSPQMVLKICTERARQQREQLAEALGRTE